MSPDELGNKRWFLNHQCSTGIVFSLLLLLPSMLSTCYQTNEENAGNVSEDFLSFSRNEPLHLLLDAFVENDEEETLPSSLPHNRRENISLVQYQSNSFFQWDYSWCEEPAGSLLCVFAFAFDRHAKSVAFSFNAYSSS